MLLAEELLLIGIDDKSGRISTSVSGTIHHGIAGALLIDLLIREKISLKNGILVLEDNTHIGDFIIDDIIDLMKKQRDPLILSEWMIILKKRYIGSYRKYLFQRLVKDGILGYENNNKLKIFHESRRPLISPDIKEDILLGLQNVALSKVKPDARSLGMWMLSFSIHLDNSILKDEYRSQIYKNLEKLMGYENIPEKTRNFLRVMQKVYSMRLM